MSSSLSYPALHATHATILPFTSSSNLQLFINALAHYAETTGIDLSKNPFANKLELARTPDDILQLLQEREKAFKEYRSRNRTLINCLSPVVKVLHAFSSTLGDAVSLVPFPPAKAIFVGVDALLAAASGVSSSYDALLDLFDYLGNFLKRLEIYTNIPPDPLMIDMIVKITAKILEVLALATKQIKHGRFVKFAKKLLGESEVEAVLQRLDRLTQEEARMTVAQTLGVVHGLVNNMTVVMEDGKASTDSIRQELVSLRQILNDETKKTKRDQLQRDVQRWLSPPDPSSNHDFVWKAHSSGTAEWFFEGNKLTEWKAMGSLLWIHGKVGSGKSTLLSAIIEDVEGMRAAGLATMAYYYFDFRDDKKQGRYGLLSSLLSQLSAELDSCYEVLSRLYSDNAGGTRKPTSLALTRCIKDMLSLPGQGQIYIIIDALDECPNISGRPSAREEVLELVRELVDLKLPNVHVCVSSRPEIDIRTFLDPLGPLQISLHEEKGQKEDIVKYIKSVVYTDMNMRKWKRVIQELVIDTLSEKADGMFRWVACQIDWLRHCFPSSIRGAIESLPETLDETYERMLLGIHKQKREHARRLFLCLAVSIRPLRVEELAEIFTFQFDEADHPTFDPDWRHEDAEEAVLSACSSLISIIDVAGSRIVQFSHFSVKEYLTSERLAKAEEPLSCYHIIPEPAHTLLAHASLIILLQFDDKIDRKTIRHFPLAMYAARHWVDHAQFKDVSSHIQGVMERLFDPARPHLTAWAWLYDIDHPWVEPMSDTKPTLPSVGPLYYASSCGFRSLVEHLIVDHSLDIDGRGGSHGTALHVASVKGHLEVVSLLLSNGADPNPSDDGGRTPLHRISQGGPQIVPQSVLGIVRLLLDSGAHVNICDDGGWTPLHTASQHGHRDIAELLLESGASLDARNNEQETPLDVACYNGMVEVSRFLIDRGSDLKSRDSADNSLLHDATAGGHSAVARLLLENGIGVDLRGADRWTPLHFASKYGYLDTAVLLLDHGADVNAYEVDRWSPLHLASDDGHFDVARLLIERGANVDSRDNNQNTPLFFASANGFLDIARLLIDHGATVSSLDRNGWTPLHAASKSGHLDVAKFFLDCGVHVDSRNGSGQTSLHLACSSGKLDVVRFLIEQGSNIHTMDKYGSSLVHVASDNGHLEVVRLLIDRGIAVDIRDVTSKTPLAIASIKGQVEVCRLLIERGANLNPRDNFSWTPLHYASQHGRFDITQLLLDRGVDANIQTDRLWRPLHLASANNHLKVVKLLVQHGACVDILNDNQETPLDLAACKGNVDVIRFLIDYRPNLHNIDSNGWTPLHTASQSGQLEVVKLLLRRGADIGLVSYTNQTAAELASSNGHVEVARFLAECGTDANVRKKMQSPTLDTSRHRTDDDGRDKANASLLDASEEGDVELVESMLEQGVNINARDEDLETPLHRAAFKGKVEVVNLLLERGAEVDTCDSIGWTPLHSASRNGHLEVSRALIDHGANVNSRNKNHWTPIHMSAGNGHLRVVELLLERGADVNALNIEGQTPLQASQTWGYRNISYLLRKHASLGA